MLAIFKRELSGFLNSQMAYIIIGVFLTVCGLMFWFYPDTSILNYGYAEMDGFFALAPFLFIFLISAITMRSFAEERKEGTYVLLATRPLSELQIILAKYLACVVLVLFAILPTLIYDYSIYQLGMPKGNIDGGAVMGSYIGLFLLGSAFAAIGIFASSVTKNQIVSFSISALLCFFAYNGFESISKISFFEPIESSLQQMGISQHYESISRGVLDTRDVIYFCSFIAVFLLLTKLIVGDRKW